MFRLLIGVGTSPHAGTSTSPKFGHFQFEAIISSIEPREQFAFELGLVKFQVMVETVQRGEERAHFGEKGE